MKRIFDIVVSLVLISLTLAPFSTGQVATGAPPFGSFGGGPFDTVNLGNLNVHFAVPILHKAGRAGFDFTYDLSYDSSVWYPVTVSGSQSWQPVLNWGWRGPTEMASGYVTYTSTNSGPACPFGQNYYGTQYTQSNWTYHDSFGVAHPFAGTTIHYIGSPAYCPADTTLISNTGDGSGWKLWAVGITVHNMTATSGKVINPPVNSSGGAALVTDANGNQISVDGSGNFFDTLSNATAVLSATGSGTPASPLKFGYIPPTGTRVYVQANYVQYTVKTNFGATDSQGHAIGEYGPTSIALIDNIALPDGSRYSFSYERTPGTCTPLSGTFTGYCVTARIASVTLPTGGQVTYAYSGGTNGIVNDGSTAGLNRTLNPGGTWTYTRNQVSGAHWTTTISDPTFPTNQTLIDFQKNSAAVTPSNFYETQRVSFQGSVGGTALKTAIVCYNGVNVSLPLNCPTTPVSSPIKRTTLFTYLPDSNGLRAETDTTYDNSGLGLLTEVDEYDFGGSSPTRKTLVTYAALGNNIVDHAATVKVQDVNNSVKASTTYGYDETGVVSSGVTQQHVSISGSRGNLTTINTQANASTNLYRKFTHYDTGSLSTSTEPSTSSSTNGAATTYNYTAGTASCNNAFPTSISVPLSLSRSMTWNCTGGVLLTATDENSRTTTTTYSDSSFWRPASISFPDGGQTSFTYNTVSTPWNVQFSSKIDSTHTLTSETVLDGFGRTTQTQLTSDPSGTVYTDMTYDSVGRVGSRSNPYRTTSDPTYGITSYQYDALNRVTQIARPGGSTVLPSYTRRAAQVQDEGNGTSRVSKIYQYDALGRLSYTCEVSSTTQLGISPTPSACGLDIGGTGFLTSYGYDILDNVTSVTQGGINPRTYAYDMLSRLTSEANPESGTTTYSYDTGTAGDLYQRVAPKPNQTGTATVTTTYSFDTVHRLTAKSYNDGTPTASFFYDETSVLGASPQNPKGRLTHTTASGGQALSVFSYDNMGRVLNHWQWTPLNYTMNVTGSFPVTYTYDLLGDLTSIVNGKEGVTYTYSYDTAARITKLQSSFSDANHPGTLLTVNSYNPLGEIAQATLGNGVVRNLQYDSRGRVTSLTDGSLYSFTLGYAPDSNVLTGNDSLNGNWTYTYDDFSRLATSSKTGLAFNYKYDRYANRWQQNVTTGSGPNPSYTFDATNHISGSGIIYDAAGNITNDGLGNSYSYDGENRSLTVTGSSSASYVYDAVGRRVRQTVGSSNYDYIFDLSARAITQLNPNWNWSELYVGGVHVATYAGGSTYFDHSDWLSTVRVHSNVSGGSAGTCTSLPFGDAQTCVGTNPGLLHFTGQPLDSESNLHHFLFRQSSTTQGRWLSADPAGLAAVNPADPQSLNRYAYVWNSPLSLVDPLGLCSQGLDTSDTWDETTNTLTVTVPCISLEFEEMYLASWGSNTSQGGGSGTTGGGPGANGSGHGANIGEIKRGDVIHCAAGIAEQSSLATKARLPGPQNPTAVDKTVGFLGNAVFGNTFSGIVDFIDTARTATNAAPVYVSLATNGLRLGLPGGGIASQGLVGTAQDTVLKGAFSNLGIYRSVAAASVVGNLKIGYDLLTFGSALFRCTF